MTASAVISAADEPTMDIGNQQHMQYDKRLYRTQFDSSGGGLEEQQQPDQEMAEKDTEELLANDVIADHLDDIDLTSPTKSTKSTAQSEQQKALGDHHKHKTAAPLRESIGNIFNPQFLNVLLASIAFCIIFTGFGPTQGFASTLYKDLGFYSLAVLYAAFAMFNFVAPFFENLLGDKLSFIISGLTYASLVFCFSVGDRPITPYLLCTAAAFTGCGCALLWTAQGNFIVKCSDKTNLGFHTGVFFTVFQLNQIVGNALIGFLFSSGVSQVFIFVIMGSLSAIGSLMNALLRPTDQPIKAAASSVSTAAELRTLEEGGEAAAAPQHPGEAVEATEAEVEAEKAQEQLKKPNKLQQLLSTFMIFKHRNFLLIIPLVVYFGYSQSYTFGSMTKAMGAAWIGWAMIGFGITECIGSFAMGKLNDRLGLNFVVFTAFAAHSIGITCGFIIGQWPPYMYFVTAFVFGLADTALNTAIFIILGYLFPRDTSAAFAGKLFCQASAICFGLLSQSYLQYRTILCMMVAMLLVGNAMYLAMDLLNRREKKKLLCTTSEA